MQETLVKAWRGLAGFRGGGSLRSWLYSIATNTCLNLKRAGMRRPATPVAEVPEAAAGASRDAYEVHEQLELLFLAVLQRLPARQRAVLLLREALGWSPGEIADLLGAAGSA